MSRQLVRYKGPVEKPTRPKIPSWQIKLQKPWTSFCDTRATVAVVLRLHCDHDGTSYVSIENILSWIHEGDYKALTPHRRVDVHDAFLGRTDIPNLVPLLVSWLVGVGVLISEYEHDGDVYHLDPDEIKTLDAYHNQVTFGKLKNPNLRVI